MEIDIIEEEEEGLGRRMDNFSGRTESISNGHPIQPVGIMQFGRKSTPSLVCPPNPLQEENFFLFFFTEKWIYKQVCRGKYPEREKSLCCIILCNTSSRPEMPMQKTGETEPAFSMMSAFYY